MQFEFCFNLRHISIIRPVLSVKYTWLFIGTFITTNKNIYNLSTKFYSLSNMLVF